MSLKDDVEAAAISNARADMLALEVGQLKRVVRDQQAEIDRLQKLADYSGRALHVPNWLTRKPKKNSPHRATVCTNLSDLHLDEKVNPNELSYHNAFDRSIAMMRLESYFAGTVKVTSHYWSSVTYDGIVLFLSGDTLSGMIHDLDATNDGDGPLESIEFWLPRLAQGIELFADEYGRAHVPCVVGNHPRLDAKPRSKQYVRRNFEWKLYMELARWFDKDERVTFSIPDDTEQLVSVYDTTFMQYHGVVGGGNGIGGIWPPLMKLVARLHGRWGAFDAMVCGHWHQHVYAPEQGLLINGSLKGYDEFARSHHFTPERAQQMLWLVTPEHGCTWNSPVFVTDRKREGW